MDKLEFKLDKADLIKIRNKVSKNSLEFFLKYYTKEGTMKGGFTRWAERQKDTGKKILFKSGHMKTSFEIINHSSTEVSIINKAPYSGYHQDGDGNLPVREIMYNSPELEKLNEDLIVEMIDDIFLKK